METLTEEQRRALSPGAEAGQAATPQRSTTIALLVAMRPPEWIKNLLVFAGLLFSQKLNQGPQVAEAVITFVAFCAISSAGYLVNDLRDAPLDRRHPEKRRRPIAAASSRSRSPRSRRQSSRRSRSGSHSLGCRRALPASLRYTG